MDSPRQRIVVTLAFLIAVPFAVGADEPAAPDLLGRSTEPQLREAPFADWFDPGYTAYVPSAAAVAALRDAGSDRLELTVFFGTWCGDSRRELPPGGDRGRDVSDAADRNDCRPSGGASWDWGQPDHRSNRALGGSRPLLCSHRGTLRG